MPVVTDEIRDQVVDIITDILEIEKGELTETGIFTEEYEADSMRAIEMLAALELAFDVTIDQSELQRMVNLRGVYEVLAEAR